MKCNHQQECDKLHHRRTTVHQGRPQMRSGQYPAQGKYWRSNPRPEAEHAVVQVCPKTGERVPLMGQCGLDIVHPAGMPT